MSKPIQSMFEKRRSRLTNTRSERAMERGLVAPEPAATSGKSSCLGSGVASNGLAGEEGLGTGGTGDAMNSCLAADSQTLGFWGARVNSRAALPCLPCSPLAGPFSPALRQAAVDAVTIRDVVESECGTVFHPPAANGGVLHEPRRVEVNVREAPGPRGEAGRHGHGKLGFDHPADHQAQACGASD